MIETGAIHTRLVVLLGRIEDAFRAAGLVPPATAELQFTAFAADGRTVGRSQVVRPVLDDVYVWESRAEIPGSVRPLEGTVLVEAVLRDDRGRVIDEAAVSRAFGAYGGIVDFTTDWYEDGVFITTSHVNVPVRRPASAWRTRLARLARAVNACRRRWSAPGRRARPGAVSVFADDAFESRLFYYAWEQGLHTAELSAELRNAAGDSRRAPLPALAARSFASVPVETLFPGARQFLAGAPGNLLLDEPVPLLTTNPRFYVQTSRRGRGTFGVDHSYLEHEVSPTSTPLSAWRAAGKGLHSPALVVERAGCRTALALFNMVAADVPKEIGVLLYDAKGALVVDRRPAVTLAPRGGATIFIRDLLDGVGYGGDFVGHAEVLYAMERDPMPDMLHHQVLYLQDGLVEGVQHMVGSWNAPRDAAGATLIDPQDLGKKAIRAPAYANDDCGTWLGLTNCSHAWAYDVEADVEIILQAGGAPLAHERITIAPHGTWFESLETLFPAARALLRPHGGIGLATVRPLNVRTLAAQYAHVQRASSHFSSEHTL